MLVAIVKNSNNVVQDIIVADSLSGRMPPTGYSLVDVSSMDVHRGYIYNPDNGTFSYGGMIDDYRILLLGGPQGPAGGTNYRCNFVTFTLVALTQDIVFSSALPDANYGVVMFPSITVSIPTLTKTKTGFRAIASISLQTTVFWMAMPYQ